MLEKFTKILIPISIVIAGLLIAGAFIYVNQNKGAVLSSKEVGDKVIEFINKNIPSAGNAASLISIAEEGSIYKIRLKVGDSEYDSYATKDGKFLFPEGYNLEATTTQETQNGDNASTEVPKSDNPDIKLFVMSYCPYGLQAEKMFLPVYDLLKDKAEMGVYFVNYIMHEKQEIDENLRQYCIQKEEKEKYGDYLSCFVQAGDFAKCFSQTGVTGGRIENCIFETDKEFNITTLYNNKDSWLNGSFPRFDVQTDLNEKYGIQGSPTIVINDQVVNIDPRSPERFKEIICQAFSSPPEECSQTLSSDVPSPGIGAGTGSASGGGCAQ